MRRAETRDTRVTETARESRERFLRVLQADVAWWRENAAAVPDRRAKTLALEIALELERLKDRLSTYVADDHRLAEEGRPVRRAEIAGKEFVLVTETERADRAEAQVEQLAGDVQAIQHDYSDAFRRAEAAELAVGTLQTALRQVEHERDEARLDALYHSDCRPNRRQAEAWLADAKAMNDKWADEVRARHAVEDELAALQTALRQLSGQWRREADAWEHETSEIDQVLSGNIAAAKRNCADDLESALPALEPTP